VQADAHTGTRVDLALKLELPMSTLNTTVNNMKQMNKLYTMWDILPASEITEILITGEMQSAVPYCFGYDQNTSPGYCLYFVTGNNQPNHPPSHKIFFAVFSLKCEYPATCVHPQ